jgi:hypothetical protein
MFGPVWESSNVTDVPDPSGVELLGVFFSVHVPEAPFVTPTVNRWFWYPAPEGGCRYTMPRAWMLAVPWSAGSPVPGWTCPGVPGDGTQAKETLAGLQSMPTQLVPWH